MIQLLTRLLHFLMVAVWAAVIIVLGLYALFWLLGMGSFQEWVRASIG